MTISETTSSSININPASDTCLANLTDYIKQQQDVVLLDLQKVFDTVDHRIVLMKPEVTGPQKSLVSVLLTRAQVIVGYQLLDYQTGNHNT